MTRTAQALLPEATQQTSLQVLKFGGTSVGRSERLDDLTAIVGRAREAGSVLVVVSALSGVTDELSAALDAATAGEPPVGLDRRLRSRHLEDPRGRLSREAKRALEQALDPHLRELSRLLDGVALLGEVPKGIRHRVLALGERLSAPRVAAWLRSSGLDAGVVDGASVLRVRDDGAEPEVDARATRQRVLENLSGLFAGQVPVVTGFVGADERGRTITLGRGASDLSATVLAAALDADAVEIRTDTDGIFTADPRVVPNARPIRQLGYGDTGALARYGAKVLHPRTLSPVSRAGIPVAVRSTLDPEAPGTRIGVEGSVGTEGKPEAAPKSPADIGKARAVSAQSVVRLELGAAHGVRLASRSFAAVERLGIDPLVVRSSPGSLTLLVRRADADSLELELNRELHDSPARVGRDDDLSAVAVLPGSGSDVELLSSLPGVLAQRGVEVDDLFLDRGADVTLAVAVVDGGLADMAVQAVHAALIDQGSAPRPARPRLSPKGSAKVARRPEPVAVG